MSLAWTRGAALVIFATSSASAAEPGYARPSFELGGDAGYAFAGYTAGAELLLRMHSGFATGAQVWYARFPDRPSQDPWSPAGSMVAVTVPLRVYWFDSGRWDPWVQLSLGGAESAGSGNTCGSNRSGLAVGLGSGVGAFVSHTLRMTLALDAFGILAPGVGCDDAYRAGETRGSDPRTGEVRATLGVVWGPPAR